ncbi:NAD-binding protein, partial [archaeon]|nr:NAD-binding protein [archaeon]
MPLWVTRLLRILGLLALLVAYGTLAFHLTEGVSLYDSLYWTVTVLSTVGFGDITPTTAVGKAVFMSLAVGGITLFGYAVTQLGSLFLETELDKVLRRTLLGGSERKMRDHVVILGWNAETSVAYEELRVNKIPTVVVVEEEQTARRLSRRNISAVIGDPRRERTLQEARLNDARGLLVALEDDTRSL